MGSHHREIAAEIDEAVPGAALPTQGGDAVRRVLLHVAAEVELHARYGQRDAGPFPTQLVPADARQERPDLLAGGNAPRREIPDPAQDAGGDVEEPFALLEAGGRVVEQSRRLLVDDHAGRIAGAAVDPGRDAVVDVAGVLRLEPADLALAVPGQSIRTDARLPVQMERAGAAHRAESVATEHRSLLAKRRRRRRFLGARPAAAGCRPLRTCPRARSRRG
jgi:hypothetical protein